MRFTQHFFQRLHVHITPLTWVLKLATGKINTALLAKHLAADTE